MWSLLFWLFSPANAMASPGHGSPYHIHGGGVVRECTDVTSCSAQAIEHLLASTNVCVNPVSATTAETNGPNKQGGSWGIGTTTACNYGPDQYGNDRIWRYVIDFWWESDDIPSECDHGTNSPVCPGDDVENVLEASDQPCPVVSNNRSNPCDPATGNKSQIETDYESFATGGLTFARHYNSRGAYKTGQGMGAGWRHTYSRSLDEKPDKKPTITLPSASGQSASYPTVSEACTNGWGDIKSTVYSGDLASATATYVGGNICKIESGGATAAYLHVRSNAGWPVYAGSSTVKTVLRPSGANHKFELDGGVWVNKLNPGLSFEASGGNWVFTDTTDTRETFDSVGRLISITRRNGQTETLEYSLSTAQGGDDNGETLDRVTGPFGHTITFAYDTSGRLSALTTPDGTVQYAYDIDENLASVTYPDTTVRQYHYEQPLLPNHLTGITDENSDRYATWAYDAAGRAIRSEHAGGTERVEFAYNADGTTTLTMGNGAVRHYDYTTRQGARKLTMLSGDVCSTCPGGNIANRSYDSNGFLYEASDWNGNTSRTVRNSRGLTETRIDGVGSTEARTTTTVWHPTLQLPMQVTSPQNVTDYTYDADGNVLSVVVTGGGETRAWNLTYNADGQPLTIDGPRTAVNDVTTLEYYACSAGSECGQLQRVVNALGHETTYDSYDGAGRVLQMTDPNGLQTSFTYDSRGRVLTTTQTPPVGIARVTTFSYDSAGQLQTMTLPDGMELTYVYDAAHLLTSITDNLGNYISYDYDAMGDIIEEYTYDSSATLKRSLGYANDLNYRIDEITNGGFTTDLSYDLVGNLTSETDPNSNTIQHTYDALNRLDTTIDALSGLVDYGYDDHDNLTQVATANGATTSYVYDGLDNLVSETSPDRGLTTYTYDDAGNRLTMTDARGVVATYTYDALNRLMSASYPDSSENIAHGYDDAVLGGIGRLTSTTDQSGTTTYTYDAFGSVISDARQIGGVTYTVSYQYDAAGRVSSTTYPSGRTVTYARDAIGQVTQVTSNNNGLLKNVATDIAYEPFGPLKGLIYGNGLDFDYAHRTDYRTTNILATGVADKSYTFDAAGNIKSINDAVDPLLDRSYSFDPLNRLTLEVLPIAYAEQVLDDDPVAYWRLGETSGTVVADATGKGRDATYVGPINHGDLGLIASIDTAMGIETYGTAYVHGPIFGGVTLTGMEAWFSTDSLTADQFIIDLYKTPSNRMHIAQRTHGKVDIYKGGVGIVLGSDSTVSIGEPHHVAVWYESGTNTTYMMIDGVTQQDTYTGNLLAVTNPYVKVGGSQYTSTFYRRYSGTIDEVAFYNTPVTASTFADRTQPMGPGPTVNNTLTYDANGNRTSLDDGSTVTTLDYPAFSNQLTAIDTAPIQRDLSGNQTAAIGGTRTYTYDDTNRLSEILDNGLTTASYVHNALGQRTQKSVGSDTTVYVYDLNGQLLAEHDATGTLIRDYVWLNGIPVAQVDAGEVFRYLHFDHLGTPRLATDESQTVVWRWDSDAFGSTFADGDPDGDGSGVVVNLRFAGQYFDGESGLHYNYFRTYDPSTGRYLESDPIGLIGGPNTYSYALLNPISLYDPYGLWVPPSLPQWLVDGSAGFGDTLSLGATGLIRDAAGIDGGVNKCSTAYSAGEWTGIGLGLAAGGAGLARGGLRLELGNFKQGGQWFFRQGTRGPHAHYGVGAGLQTHHLPYQARNWFQNLRGLIGRGEAGRDLGNLGLIGYGAAVPASAAIRDNDCECSE